MTTRTWARVLQELPGWLVQELAPVPGRYETTLRLVVAMTIVIVLSLALRIPMLALSILIVFFVGQENTSLTRLSGVVMLIGSTLANGLVVLLLKFTMGDPLLRMLGSCAIAFLGVYFMRTSRLGIVGFGAALAAVYIQSLVDIYDSPEELTRLNLWVWVAINYPMLVTVLVNELIFPLRPGKLLKREMNRQLGQVLTQLEARINASKHSPLRPRTVADDLARLHRHFEYAQHSDSDVRRHRERYLRRVLAVDRLCVAAINLAIIPDMPLTADQIAVFRALRERCAAFRAAIAEGSPFPGSGEMVDHVQISPQLAAAVHEITCALDNAHDSEEEPTGISALIQPYLFKPDAWHNAVYTKFSLRTVLVTMFCYVLYTAVQWPGIHTVMLTCIIVAMPSVGTMTHKGINRVIGCALGSLAALICTVFVIPGLDGIVGLLFVVVPILGLGAWIAAGSSRIAYVGHQFVFAFALAEFGPFGPTTDVTKIRDRMIGILLGVGISILATLLIWPEREEDNWRTGFRQLRKNMADMLRSASMPASPSTFFELRRGGLDLLSHCRELLAAVYFESRGNPTESSTFGKFLQALLKAQDLFFSITLFHALAANAQSGVSRHSFDVEFSTLDRLGDALEALAPHADSESESNTWSEIQGNEQSSTDSTGRHIASGVAHLAASLCLQTNELIRSATEAKA